MRASQWCNIVAAATSSNMVVSRCARAAPALLALMALLVHAEPCGEDFKGSDDGKHTHLKPQLMRSGECFNAVYVDNKDCEGVNQVIVGLRVSACDDDTAPDVKVHFNLRSAYVQRTGDCKGWGSIRTTVVCHDYDSSVAHVHRAPKGLHGNRF